MRESKLDPSSSPLAAFGDALRKVRKAKGKTLADVAGATNYSVAYVSDAERAVRLPPRRFAIRCDEYLETGGVLTSMWWQAKHTESKEGFPELTALEVKAVLLRLFEIGIVPGLFQTEEYAMASEASNVRRGRATQAQTDERVAFRMSRQKLLERDPAPTVHAVLDEACLRRNIGGPQVMARQLRHLERLALRPNIVLQVAPFDMVERPPFIKPVTLLTLPDRTLVGYTESLQRGFLEREQEEVAAWSRDYDRLQVEALTQADSLALIRAVRKELVNMGDMTGPSGPSWRKSTYSEDGGQCVEIAPGLPGVVPVRDSKDPDGPALRFSGSAFAAFVCAVKGGEFPAS